MIWPTESIPHFVTCVGVLWVAILSGSFLWLLHRVAGTGQEQAGWRSVFVPYFRMVDSMRDLR